MPGRSHAEALRRRRQVEALELRGATPAAIARDLGADLRTIKRDLRMLAQQRARAADLTAERRRLLDAARLVEKQAWELFDALPAADPTARLAALGKVLAGQSQTIKLLGDLAAADIEARLAALEEALIEDSPSPRRGEGIRR